MLQLPTVTSLWSDLPTQCDHTANECSALCEVEQHSLLQVHAARYLSLYLQIPDGDGALALHVMPRYMLHNNLLEGVQYKQQVSLDRRPSTVSNCLSTTAFVLCHDSRSFSLIHYIHKMHVR